MDVLVYIHVAVTLFKRLHTGCVVHMEVMLREASPPQGTRWQHWDAGCESRLSHESDVMEGEKRRKSQSHRRLCLSEWVERRGTRMRKVAQTFPEHFMEEMRRKKRAKGLTSHIFSLMKTYKHTSFSCKSREMTFKVAAFCLFLERLVCCALRNA